MSNRTAHEDAVAELLHRLADHARTDPSPSRNPLADELRGRRRPTWTIGVAAALLIAALASASLVLREDGERRVSTTGETASLGGTTERLADAGLEGRSGAASVWTGKELLVWGGLTSQNEWLADGAALDPATNRWRPLPKAPIAARSYPAAVWTGKEMLVWGGYSGEARFVDGVAFNPETNRWRMIASNPFGGVMRPAVAWTGREMLVFSSTNGPPAASAYDLRSDSWRRLPPPPGLLVMPYPQVVWTGNQAILVLWPDDSTRGAGPTSAGPSGTVAARPDAGTSPPSSPPGTPPPLTAPPLPTGGGPNSNMFLVSYSPESDQWSRLPEVALRDGGIPSLVWTGREVLLLQSKLPVLAFEPKQQTWRSGAPMPENPTVWSDSPVWTGRLALLWAGGEEGLAYDPAADVWSTFDAGGLRSRSSAVVAWADGLLVGWSGFNNHDDGRGRLETDGIRYRPPRA